jgi:hypothetical protein
MIPDRVESPVAVFTVVMTELAVEIVFVSVIAASSCRVALPVKAIADVPIRFEALIATVPAETVVPPE